jgi:hypothetical protein
VDNIVSCDAARVQGGVDLHAVRESYS